MKTNKGIIGIGLLVAIVLGVAVVGGGAYYLGKSSSNDSSYMPDKECGFNGEKCIDKDKNLQQVDQNQVVVENQKTSEISSKCNSNSPSTIKLLSPNGGETYAAGQKITVKWESCNVNPNSISFSLFEHDTSKQYQQSEMYRSSVFTGSNPYVLEANDGISEFTLPDFTNKNLIVGQRYFIGIMGDGDITNIGSGYIPSDYSDGLFTILYPKTLSANGITITVPDNDWLSYYTYDNTERSNSFALNIQYNGSSITINKFNNKSSFNDHIPVSHSSEYESVNMNYSVNNMLAQYYKNSTLEESGGGSIIVIPSKLVTIEIPYSTFTFITQSEFDQIIGSIKIN